MMIDMIASIAQLIFCGAMVGYIFYVVHKWSKAADNVNAKLNELTAQDEEAGKGEADGSV